MRENIFQLVIISATDLKLLCLQLLYLILNEKTTMAKLDGAHHILTVPFLLACFVILQPGDRMLLMLIDKKFQRNCVAYSQLSTQLYSQTQIPGRESMYMFGTHWYSIFKCSLCKLKLSGQRVYCISILAISVYSQLDVDPWKSIDYMCVWYNMVLTIQIPCAG